MRDPSRGPVVLVIDDEEEFLFSTARLLRRRGFEVLTAQSGEAALHTLRLHAVDAVVLDLRMPGMDGDEVLHRMAAEGHGQPVVMLTGHGSVDHAVRMGRAGVAGYLTKPCDIEVLERTLREALEARPRPEPHRPTPRGPVSVLLVDDEPELLDSLSKVLRTRGLEVHAASTGQQGLALLAELEVDVVVLDIKMPGMDGLEVLREIQRGPFDCEVILLTGAPRGESTLRSLRLGSAHDQLGVAGYVTKPPDVPELVDLIRQAAARRRERLG